MSNLGYRPPNYEEHQSSPQHTQQAVSKQSPDILNDYLNRPSFSSLTPRPTNLTPLIFSKTIKPVLSDRTATLTQPPFLFSEIDDFKDVIKPGSTSQRIAAYSNLIGLPEPPRKELHEPPRKRNSIQDPKPASSTNYMVPMALDPIKGGSSEKCKPVIYSEVGVWHPVFSVPDDPSSPQTTRKTCLDSTRKNSRSSSQERTQTALGVQLTASNLRSRNSSSNAQTNSRRHSSLEDTSKKPPSDANDMKGGREKTGESIATAIKYSKPERLRTAKIHAVTSPPLKSTDPSVSQSQAEAAEQNETVVTPKKHYQSKKKSSFHDLFKQTCAEYDYQAVQPEPKPDHKIQINTLTTGTPPSNKHTMEPNPSTKPQQDCTSDIPVQTLSFSRASSFSRALSLSRASSFPSTTPEAGDDQNEAAFQPKASSKQNEAAFKSFRRSTTLHHDTRVASKQVDHKLEKPTQVVSKQVAHKLEKPTQVVSKQVVKELEKPAQVVSKQVDHELEKPTRVVHELEKPMRLKPDPSLVHHKRCPNYGQEPGTSTDNKLTIINSNQPFKSRQPTFHNSNTDSSSTLHDLSLVPQGLSPYSSDRDFITDLPTIPNPKTNQDHRRSSLQTTHDRSRSNTLPPRIDNNKDEQQQQDEHHSRRISLPPRINDELPFRMTSSIQPIITNWVDDGYQHNGDLRSHTQHSALHTRDRLKEKLKEAHSNGTNGAYTMNSHSMNAYREKHRELFTIKSPEMGRKGTDLGGKGTELGRRAALSPEMKRRASYQHDQP